MEKKISIWDKLVTHLPVHGCIQYVGFNTIKEEIEEFLIVKEVFPQAFSHFGFVVSSIDSSIDNLKTFDSKISGPIIRDWVKAYKVYVGRIMFGDRELEFIEPKGESFFSVFLKEKGEGLQHLAFQVNDIEGCFEKLKKNGVEAIDKEPSSGSHGKIAFFNKPRLLGSVYIELFQEYK
jgi:methylmalonyl-CoA epimerase